MPPTDNIYKFIAISGLLIYLFSGNLAVIQYVKYREVKNLYLKDSIVFSNKLMQDSILMLEYDFKLSKNDSTNNEMDGHLINAPRNISFKLQKLKANIEMNKALILNAKESVADKWYYTEKTAGLFVFALIFGSAISMIGFYKWRTRIQIPNEEKMGLTVKKTKFWIYYSFCILFIVANFLIIAYLGKK